MDFKECLKECVGNRELITQFNRIYGAKLFVNDRRPLIYKMIHEASGYDKKLMEKQAKDYGAFITFVYDYIWLPLLNSKTNH